jgi:hypothetical protein
MLHLTIDGREVSMHDTVRLYQADPFPGGCWYELVIGEARGRPWDHLEPNLKPLPEDQRDLLWALEGLVAADPGEGSPPAAYALNTVATVEVQQGEIRLTGVCSPIVAHQGG